MEFIDIKVLFSFCKLVETKSFSKAAAELFITQPALSTHISKLEDYLGIELVYRSSREIELTYAGKVFYKKAKKIIKEFTNAKAYIDEIKGIKSGVIDIGASTLPGEYILPQIVKNFYSNFPEININIHIKDTFTIIDEVSHGNYDFGIVGSKENVKNIDFISILEDKIFLVGLNKPNIPDKISLDNLSNFPIIAREKGSGTFHSVLKKIDVSKINFKIVAGSLEAVKNLIKNDVGLSFLSIHAIKDELDKNIFKIIEIEGITPIRRWFYFIKKTKTTLSPSSEKFFQMMLKFLKN